MKQYCISLKTRFSLKNYYKLGKQQELSNGSCYYKTYNPFFEMNETNISVEKELYFTNSLCFDIYQIFIFYLYYIFSIISIFIHQQSSSQIAFDHMYTHTHIYIHIKIYTHIVLVMVLQKNRTNRMSVYVYVHKCFIIRNQAK